MQTERRKGEEERAVVKYVLSTEDSGRVESGADGGLFGAEWPWYTGDEDMAVAAIAGADGVDVMVRFVV